MKLIEASGAKLKSRRQHKSFGSSPDDIASDDLVLCARSGEFESTIVRAVKRSVDVEIALPVGFVLLPWLVVIAAVIKCVWRGPVFYGQVRLGQNGEPFRMWKFLTMVEDAERCLDEYLAENPGVLQEWNTGFKLKNDPRVIPWVGQLLRVSSLDELPQLWNVLAGEMSLVGPRPLPKYHLDSFEEDFRILRESMPPGITGQWQVFSRKNGTPEMFRKWDTYYVVNWSLWLDLKILTLTPWAVLFAARVRELPATEAAVRHS